MKLVIVESPTKAKTIGKFLGSEFTIKASMGHILDLPKSTLGVDIEKDFAPEFVIMKDKEKTLSDLKSAAKGSSEIFLATDPDREGEAIASHVKDVLTSNGKLKTKNEKFKRVVFHEITEEAIAEAFKNPRTIDKNLVDAQIARRVLDRLVGYKLSPLLWQKIRRGLSAGRVQSVALRLIVEREREIEKFKKENYWTIVAVLSKSGSNGVEFELIEINGEKIEQQESFSLYDGEYTVTKTLIDTEQKAKDIEEDLKTKTFTVSEVSKKETKRSPAPPFITSTLQIAAASRFGMTGKRTMSLAQKLYEEGYITYHRTDSVVMSTSAQGAMLAFIEKEFGKKYAQPRNFKTKQKLAQEAHEAIRPTKVGVTTEQVTGELGKDFGKLYDLIWKRAVASQMSDAIIDSTTVVVESQTQNSKLKSQNDGTIYKFKTNGSVLLFDGFLKVNPLGLEDKRLPDFVDGEKLQLVSATQIPHETSAPPRYNDSSLIKTLEEKEIGRPSTYASIVSTILERIYVEKEEGRFTPTPVGIAVNDFLVEHFSDIDDIPFTAQMEDELDTIAHGKKEWVPILKDFWGPFEKKLKSVKDAKRVAIEVEETDQKCEKCSSPMVIRIGRFGKFLSCSTFPECDFKKAYIEETGIACPKDGGNVIIKKTRKGRKFFGCSNYPNCDFAAWKLEDIKSGKALEKNKAQENSTKEKELSKNN